MLRFFDVLLSVCAIVLLTPFMIPVVVVLLLTGEHQVFYLQPRVGRNGTSFKVIKFATMLKNSPQLEGGFITQHRDPRVLPFGKFLRKSKINELPQLINILLGEMSFVGPRPVVSEHLNLYPEVVQASIKRLRPGLTGLGSLVLRDEEGVLDRAGGDRKFFHDAVIAPYKGELELWYADHQSIGMYFAVILLTGWSILFPRTKLHFLVFRSIPKPGEQLLRLL